MFSFFAAALPPVACAEPTTVKEVEVEGLVSMKQAELLYLLDIRPGVSLEEDAVTRGIKRAFKSQIFEDITVEADDAQEGLVRVKVREKTFIDDIKIKGAGYGLKKAIKERLTIKEGDPLVAEALDADRARLLALMGRKGFPSAELKFLVEEKRRYRVKVTLVVNTGEPAYVRLVDIAGGLPPGVDLPLGIGAGDVYDQTRLEEGMEKARGLLKKMGYVDPSVGPYAFDNESGILTVHVDPGIRLAVGLKGNDSIRDDRLLEAMPFATAGAVRSDLVEEASVNILDIYHESGFPDAQAAPVVRTEDGVTHVDFYINEGRKVLVDSVAFKGVSLPESGLRKIMATGPRDVYSQAAVESDVQKLLEFYHALGYKDAAIGEPEVRISESWATVTINVEEGRRYTYSEVLVEGARSVPGDEVYGVIKIKPGEPFNEVDISDTRRAVVSLFRDNGFPQVDVRVETEFVEHGARVTFRVDEGEMRFFGKTVVAGNITTRTEVIRRELRYEEGAPLDTSRLVDTRQRLYKLGIFDKVEIKTSGGEGDEEDVVIAIEEGRPGTVDLGLGYSDYEEFRGYLDVRYRNLLGMNRQASARLEVSSISNRQILNYQEPWFLGREITASIYLIREERDEKNIDTGEISYRVRKHTARAGVEKQLTKHIKGALAYEFSVVKTFDVQPDVVLTKEDTGTLKISSIIPSAAFDTRDNPFDPQRGFFAGASVKFATSLLLSETDFVKATVHASTYRKLTDRFIVALSLRGGAAQGFNETEELPLIERFFLGGRDTVRGFDQDELGPKGEDGTPTGGNAFLIGNFEIRTRIAKNWRAVPFLDAGNVWVRSGELDPSDLRYTAGLGLQYNTPVGPIRVDYGRKIDREPDESSGEVHFSIGHAF